MPDSPDRIEASFPPQKSGAGKSSAWQERLKIYGTALLVGLAVGLYALIVSKHGGGDFASLYLADARLLADQPIYWAAPEVGPSNQDCPEGGFKDQVQHGLMKHAI